MLQLSEFVLTNYVLRYESFLTIFSLSTQQLSTQQKIEVRLVEITIIIFDVSLYPLSFFANTPFKCIFGMLPLWKFYIWEVAHFGKGLD